MTKTIYSLPVPTGPATCAATVKVVFDRSYSMGAYAQIVSKAIPGILLSAGYPTETPVDVITFDYPAGKGDDEPKRIRAGGAMPTINNRGNTYLAPAVRKLRAIMESDSSPCHLIIVSDGALHDVPAAKRELATLHKAIVAAGRDVAVTAVRLFTSEANPDTSALCAFAMLGDSEVVDIHGAPDVAVEEIARIIRAAGPVRRITAPPQTTSVTAYLNGATASQSLDVLGDMAFVIGEMVDGAEPIGAAQAELLSKRVVQWAASARIAGFDRAALQRAAELAAMLDNLLVADDGAPVASRSVVAEERLRTLRKSVQGQQRGISGRIAEIMNNDRVAAFNARQQAEYLRGMDNSSAAKSAVRRMAASDVDQMVTEAAEKLAKAGIAAEADGARSWVSLNEPEDLPALAKEALAAVGTVGAQGVLPVLGMLGVAVRINRSKLPDPWLVQVLEIFPGMFLGTDDIFAAGADPLPVAGTNGAEANGVVPLVAACGPDAFAAGRNLMQVTAGVSMRGAIGAVPYDAHALAVGALRRAAGDAFENGTTAVTTVTQQLRDTVCQLMLPLSDAHLQLHENLHNFDYLTGDNGVTGANRMMAVWVATHAPGEADALSARYMAALVIRRWANQQIKCHADTVQDTYRALLGVDPAQVPQPRPLFEPEPEVQFPGAGAVRTEIPNNIARELLEIIAVCGLDAQFPDAWTHDIMAQQLDRAIRREKGAACELDSEPAAAARHRLAAAEYSKEYDALLKDKQQREGAELDRRTVAAALDVTTSEAFACTIGERIPAAGQGAYKALVAALGLGGDAPAPASAATRAAAAWVLATGHAHVDGQLTPMWNSGRRGMTSSQVAKLRSWLDDDAVFAAIEAKYLELRHRYRDDHNRHGYGNNCPSWWALGYSSKEAMEEAVGPAVMQGQKHVAKGGGSCSDAEAQAWKDWLQAHGVYV